MTEIEKFDKANVVRLIHELLLYAGVVHKSIEHDNIDHSMKRFYETFGGAKVHERDSSLGITFTGTNGDEHTVTLFAMMKDDFTELQRSIDNVHEHSNTINNIVHALGKNFRLD